MKRLSVLVGMLATLGVLAALGVGAVAVSAADQGVLGVSLTSLNDAFRQRTGSTATAGVGIMRVMPDSGAAKAGIKVGDVITRVAGAAVTTPDAVSTAIAGKAPGATVVLTIQTGSAAPRDVTVTLGSQPVRPQPGQGKQPGQGRGPGGPGGPHGFGDGTSGARNTISMTQGTVTAVSANSIALNRSNNGGAATYVVDANTRVLAGTTANAVTDLKVGDTVVVTTWDNASTARVILKPDAMRQNLPQRPGGAQAPGQQRPDGQMRPDGQQRPAMPRGA